MQPHDWVEFSLVKTEGLPPETHYRCRRCGVVTIGQWYRRRDYPYGSLETGAGLITNTVGAIAEGYLADGSPFATVVFEDPGCPDPIDILVDEVTGVTDRRAAVLRRMSS